MICPNCGVDQPHLTGLEGEVCGCIDSQSIEIVYPEEGGTVWWLNNYKYPFPGFLFHTTVDQNATFKRAVVALFRSLKPSTVLHPIQAGIKWVSEVGGVAFQQYPIPLKNFSHSVRELIRVLSLRELPKDFINSLAMMFEYDNAYRFRMQDVLGELNKIWLRENPRQEVLRLIDLAIERDNCVIDHNKAPNAFDLKDKWILLRRILGWGMLIPKVKREVKSFLMDLNLQEIQADEVDWYFMCERWDYNFGGKPLKERLPEKLKIDKDPNIPWPGEKIKGNRNVIGIVPTPEFMGLEEKDARQRLNNLVDNFMKDWVKIKSRVGG